MRCSALHSHAVWRFLLLCIHRVFVTPADGKQTTLTVCDGDQAAFNWPGELQYDFVETMTLTYLWSGRQGVSMATIFSNGFVTVADEFSTRIKVRGTSGLYLSDISIRDTGTYQFDGHFQNGTKLPKHFTYLIVHVPPLLEYGNLRIQMSNLSKNCQGLSCGQLLFIGYPPVSFSWTVPNASEPSEVVNQRSVIQGCPLQRGTYTCRLTGPAAKCLGYQEPPEELVFVNVSWVKDDQSTSLHDTVLIVTVPIVIVMFPLVILGLWVLKHVLTGRSYRKMQQDSSAAQLDRGISRTSTAGSSPGSPTFPQSPSLSSEAVAGDDGQDDRYAETDEDECDDDQATPMLQHETDRDSQKDDETHV